MKFRDLKADEIDVRVAQVLPNGISLLLYKDARVDMDILDEEVTPYRWQREHKELKGNIYCGISIFDDERKQWVTKWDAGKESNTEAEKGEASDSFKRAGFNWGIGRELYTSPFIWVNSNQITKDDKGKIKDKFKVSRIEIKDKKIIDLEIKNQKGIVVYSMNKTLQDDPEEETDNTINKLIESSLRERISNLGISNEEVIKALAKFNHTKLAELKFSEVPDFEKALH